MSKMTSEDKSLVFITGMALLAVVLIVAIGIGAFMATAS